MKNDFKFAFRIFGRNPAFALAVLATIGLGIGVSSAVFSIVDTVLLRPLPYPEPERIVRVWGSDKKSGRRFLELSFQDYEALGEQARSFQDVAAFSMAPRRLSDRDGRATRITVARITEGFFPVLGTPLQLGRQFSEEEFSRRNNVVILSHGLWQSRYGGRIDILGEKVYVRGQPHEVVGIVRPDAEFPKNVDLWRPLRESEIEDDDREFFVLARLADTVRTEEADVEAAAIVERFSERDPETRDRFGAWVQPLHSMLVRDVRTPLLMLLGAVALVLLIACVNVANLLLARGTVRRREMAVRAALGAERSRLVRLCLTESVILAVAGGLLGLGLGHLVLEGLIALAPGDIPRLDQVTLDGRVTGVMAGVTLLCGLLFGLAPAWTESKRDLRSGLGTSRGASRGGFGQKLRQGLVVAEVALSTILMIGAVLLLSGLRNLINFDHGFREVSLLEVPVGASGRDYNSKNDVIDLYDRLRMRLSSLPGVETFEIANICAMNPRSLRLPVQIEGLDNSSGPKNAMMRIVSPDYLQTVGLPLLEGRYFSAGTDYTNSTPTAIVNQAFVQSFFPGSIAVGRRLLAPDIDPRIKSYLVVGVVANLHPSINSDPSPAFYLPFPQVVWPSMHLLIGMSADPVESIPIIREHIWSEAPTVTLDDIGTLEQKVARTLTAPRFNTTVVGTFAVVALLLASVGLYGVLSYFVSNRSRELAIRRAIGARDEGIVLLVVKQGLILTLAGIAIGAPIAVGAARLMASQLYEVSPAQFSAYVLTAAIIALVAVLACLFPALRAIRIDPVTSLREE